MAGDCVTLKESGAERVTVTDIVVVFIDDALPDTSVVSGDDDTVTEGE